MGWWYEHRFNAVENYRKGAKTQRFCHPLHEVVGGKPAKTKADVPLLQKSDRRKLLLQLSGTRLSAADLEPETGGEADTPKNNKEKN